MSVSALSVRARLTSAISRVISGIHNSRDFSSPKPPRDRRTRGIEELEERILFGYFSLNPPWESPLPSTPSTSCPNTPGSTPGGSAGDGATSGAGAGASAGGGGPQAGGAGPGGRAGSGRGNPPVKNPAPQQSAAETSQPIIADTGLPDISATDVSSDAMGFTFAHTRSWTGLDNGSYNGNGWSNNELPYLVVGGGTNGEQQPGSGIGTGVMPGTGDDSRISVVYGGTAAYTFYNSSSTSYTPFTDYGVTLQYISAPTPVIELTDSAGNVTEFYDVHRDSSTPDPYSLAKDDLPQNYGRFKSWTSANGTTSIVATYDSNDYVTNLVRSDSVTGESDQMVYSYATVTNDLVTAAGGTPPTLLSSVTLQRSVSGSWQNVQQATYTYYTGRVSDGAGGYTDDLIGGRLGDLEYATTQNWSAASSSWQTTDTTYYRYYKFTGESDGVYSQGPTNVWYGPGDCRNTTGGPAPLWASDGGTFGADEDITVASGLKMVIDGPALARLASAVPDYQTASDATLEPYVNNYFEYERFGDHIGVDGSSKLGAPIYYSNNSFWWRTGYRSETMYRATLEIANGSGCSCSSGQGTYKYEYATNYSTDNIGGEYTNGGYGWDTYDPNVWRTKSTEFLPSDDTDWATHDRNVVYTNELGQPLLSILVHVNSTAVSITGMSIAQDPNDTNLPLNAQVTVTAPNHGLSVGDSVAISGVLPEFFDGVFKVTSVADSNTFTFTLPFTYFDGTQGDIPTPYVNANGNSSALSKVLGQWATAYRYDSQGNLIEMDEPSAVLGYDDSQMDPVDAAEGAISESNAEITDGWIAENSGIVHYYDYGSTTSATSSTPGDVAGYFKDEKISEGTNNLGFSPIILDAQNYIAHTSGGITVYALHSYTQYGQTGSGDARTTTYNYTTWLGNQVEAMTTSLPVISSAQNGPAVADTTNSFFDQYGRTIWTMDGDGHVDYTAYDASGGIVQQITDVNYSDLTTAQQSSFNTTGWTQPAGLNLVTNYTVDSQGRTTSVTSPNGNVTYTVYNDASHETRIYPGFNGTTTTGPITIYRQFWPASGSGDMYYTETITSTATPHLTGGVPDGTESISASNIASLQRDFTNSGGQVSWTDSYFNFSGLSYSQAVLPDGSGAPIDIGSQATFDNNWTGQFYRTSLLYDDRGRQDETIEPTGTIDITVFDPLGRVSSKWIGTDATPGPNGDDWEPDNQGAGSNMMDVEDDSYNDTLPATPPVPASPSLTDYGYQSYIYDPDATYYVKITYVGPGGESQFSSESSLHVIAGDALVVNSPSTASGATGWNLYVSTTSGQEVLQNTSGPMGFGGSWTEDFNNGVSTVGRTEPMLSNTTDSGNATATLSQVTTHPGLGQADRVTQFLYDWRDRQVAEKDGVQSTETDGAHRPIIYTVYDNLNEPTAGYQYDGDGIPLSDFASTAANDSAPTADSSALRAKSTSSYDDQGRVYQQQTFSVDQSTGTVGSSLTTSTFYDHRGNTIAVFSPGGQVTKSVYDGAGRLSSQYITDGGAVNNADAPQLDWTHASSVFSDVVLTETDYTYDGDGNVILTATHDRFSGDATTATGALGSPTTGVGARVYYVGDYYDAADRPITEVNVGTNGGTAWTRPSSDTDPSIARSNTVLRTDYAYDVAGNQYLTTDPRGILTQFNFDMLGRKDQEIDASTGGSPATGMNITNYAYDGDNNILTMQAYQPNGTTSPSQTTAYLYGVGGTAGTNLFSNDLLSKVEYPDPTTGNPGTSASDDVLTTYDLLGEALTQTDQNQTTHTFSRDILGRLTLDAITTLGSGVDGSVRALGYTYSPLGLPYQQTSYSDAAGTIAVNQIQDSYNGYGQLIAQYQAISGAVNTSSTPVTLYTYSQPSGANYSRLIQMIYPNGRILSYGYSSGLNSDISRVNALGDYNDPVGHDLVDYTYLGLDAIVAQADNFASGLPKLTYIKQSGESNGDAGDQITGLDRFGRVVDQRWLRTSGGVTTTLDRFQYGYDPDGNVLYKNNLVNSSFSELYHANSSASGDDASAYDDLNRITSFQRGTLSASGNNGSTLDTVATLNSLANSSQSWNLDSIGNANSVTTDGTQQNRTFNSQSEATTVGSDTLGYDSDGNTTTDDQGRTLVYDAWNRLVAVKNGSATIASYTYDANGNRVSQTENSTTTNLYYSSAGQVIEERQGSTVTSQYVWGLMYVNDLILRDDNSTSGNLGISGSGLGRRLYIQQDANWNVTAIDGATGVAERFVYTPYGVPTVLSSSWTATTDAYGLAYGFQGMRYDAVTGMLHADARDYSPTLERWTEADPAQYINGLDRYQLELSNPTTYCDPSGFGIFLPGPGPGGPWAPPILDPYWNQRRVGDPNGQTPGEAYEFGRPNWWAATGDLHRTFTTLVFTVCGSSAQQNANNLADKAYQDLTNFTSFAPNNTIVRSIGNYKQFRLTGLKGVAEAVPDDRWFSVRFFTDPATRTNRAVTLGAHPLAGIRKWGVQVVPWGKCCEAVIVYTEGDERDRGPLNGIGRSMGGEAAQFETWDTYFSNLGSVYGGGAGVSNWWLQPTWGTTLPGTTPNPLSNEIPQGYRQ